MEMRNNGKTKHVENIYIRFITHLKNISTSRQTAKKKTKKNNGIYNTCHGLLSQEWIDGRYWSPLWYVMLTKVMNST